MAKKKTGFVKISRDFLHHPYYSNGEPFTLKEVLIDLTIRAYFQDTMKLVKAHSRVYKRGQVQGTTGQMSEWWHMSRATVYRRLERLQEDGFIYVESSGVNTVVTLVKYGLEQDFNGLGDTTADTTGETTDDTTYDTTSDTTADTHYKKSEEDIYKFKKTQNRNPSGEESFFVEE